MKVDGRTTDTKQRILREAQKFYLKGGYAGISLQEIAQHLEISKPALFHHFKSKQELFYEVLRDLSTSNREVMEKATQQGENSRTRLRNALLEMRHQPFFDPMKFLNEELDELDENQQAEIKRNFFDGLHGPIMRVLQEGVKSGEFRAHNCYIGAMAFFNLMMLLPSPGNPITNSRMLENVEAYIDELLTLFVDGLKPSQ